MPRLFLGDAGSVTCAHIDLVPQLEMAHALCGTKFVGVASHAATPRLLREHAAGGVGAGGEWGDDGEESEEEEDNEGDVYATRVPTDRPLQPHEARLLGDAAISLLRLE